MSKEDCTKYRDRLPVLAENPLGPEAEPALLAHLRECPACSAEYAWLTSLCRDLEAIGDHEVKAAPDIDLTSDVMKAVALLKKPHVVELATARPRQRFSQAWWLAASAAVAAVIVATVWFTGYSVTRPDRPMVAVQTPPLNDVDNQQTASGSGRFDTARTTDVPQKTTDAETLQKLVEEMRPAPGSTGGADTTAQASLNMHDILAARKDAVNSPAARQQLAQWAELSAAKAREILANQEASMEAQVAAAESLPPEEAEKILLAAVAADPDNPYLRHQLGALYEENPETAAKAAAEYAAEAQLDPDNALAYYQLAASLLEQGDADGAVTALQNAQSLNGASPYTLDAANYQQAALEQTGVGEEVARLLVALTAGTSQYGDMTALGSQLLEYGKYYEQSGQFDLAQQIYNSVRIFGEQLANDATFANELLAGLDIQREAVTVLSGLVEFIQVPANADLLARSSERLVGALNTIGGLFTSLNEFFMQEMGGDMVNAFVDYVLTNGDLNVLDYLSGNNTR